MYVNLKAYSIGGLTDNYYWASSEASATHAWSQIFEGGMQYTSSKNGPSSVRAIRSF
jgi:hypothetical protein